MFFKKKKSEEEMKYDEVILLLTHELNMIHQKLRVIGDPPKGWRETISRGIQFDITRVIEKYDNGDLVRGNMTKAAYLEMRRLGVETDADLFVIGEGDIIGTKKVVKEIMDRKKERMDLRRTNLNETMAINNH